jgi:hypothetical protein
MEVSRANLPTEIQQMAATQPVINIVGSMVDPPSVLAGGTLSIKVSYDLVDPKPGFTADVRENWQIYRTPKKKVFSTERRTPREQGRYTSEFGVTLHKDSLPGQYQAVVEIEYQGIQKVVEQAFEIRKI